MFPWAAFVDDASTSYGWRLPTGDILTFLTRDGITVLQGEAYVAAPCARTRQDSARLVVGRGRGYDGVVQAMAAVLGTAVRTVTGTVRDAAGVPVAGAHVHAESADGGAYLSRATTGPDGAFAITVPAEGAVRLTPFLRGMATPAPAAVAAGASTAELAFGPTGTIEVQVTESGGGAVPARVQVLPDGGFAQPPRAWGERAVGGEGRLHVAFAVDGRASLRAPVGAHRVIVSRGYEYDLVSRDVTVGAGATVEVLAELTRVVGTPGALCGDFHVHTTRSPDAVDDGLRKVRSAVADGVEILLRSDHEWVRDFEPEIAAVGATAHAYGVGSMELTSFLWGHFGVFPLDPMPDAINDGIVEWYGRLTPDVLDEARARTGRYGPATVIVNHPRSGSRDQAYFDAAGYDPVTGSVAAPELWDETFSIVEVFNDSDFDANLEKSVTDWFSLLGRGRRVFATGASDSHGVSASPVGYPRTCLALGTDDPAALRAMGAGAVRDAMLAGRATVSGGIYVEATARGGVGPGGEVTGAAERETVRVRVQAAPWVSATRLRVYVDGALTETIALDAGTGDPMNPAVRFDADLEVPVAGPGGQSFAVFVADGPDALEPVHPGRRPFGVSNPIFFRR
jgi:hypothetical protein